MQTLPTLKTIALFGVLCAAAATAVGQLHVIVEAKEGCVIGGVENGRWVAAEKIEKSIKSPLNMTLYTFQSSRSETLVSEESECHASWKSQSGAELKDGVAIQSPTWNPLPRSPRAINTGDTTYVKIIRDILLGAGLKNPQVNITEGYKIDLDGDGKEEAILVASYYKQGVGEMSGVPHIAVAGDYAIVLVRKIVGGKVRNIFLVKDVRRTADAGGLIRGYHLSAIADLNGDGQMEVVLYSAYYEGSSSDVLEIRGTKVNAVLGCGCEH
jgi:hypothetical protein